LLNVTDNGMGDLMAIVQNLECASDAAPQPSVTPAVRIRKTLGNWAAFILREPFFHFIALGMAIWLGIEYFASVNKRYVIHIGPTQRQRLATAYQQQSTQPPTGEQLQLLVDRYVTEEIYVREGLALNLDIDDEVVRRRVAQKFEFLQTDLATPGSPAGGTLERWFERNQLRYITPVRVAFTQIYFSADREGDESAQRRAVKALAALRQGQRAQAAGRGDPFPGPANVGALALDAAEQLFGQSALSEELFKIPVEQWAGPFRSGYGWHLVYVTERKAPEVPRLDDIRARVITDYLDDQRHILNVRAREELRSKYTVVQDGT
jgi:hypothetical protein